MQPLKQVLQGPQIAYTVCLHTQQYIQGEKHVMER